MALIVQRVILALLLCIYGIYSVALTDEEIERRFQQLEQENALLKEKLKRVDKILKSQGIDPENPLLVQTVVPGKGNGDPNTSSRLDFAYKKINDDLSRVKFQSFLSAGLSYNDEENGLDHRFFGFNENADFNSDGVLGLQIDFRINNKAKTVVQIVGNAWDQWDPNIQWAYLAYDVTDQFSVRAGRMRLPFYLYSESLDVGYSYPWVRPPMTLYTPEIANYDGFDATYWIRSGDVSHRISAFVGGYAFLENDHRQSSQVMGDDVFGLNWTAYWNDWTYRLAYAHGESTADIAMERPPRMIANPNNRRPPNLMGKRRRGIRIQASDVIEYYSTALAYDDGNWLAIFEAAAVDVSEGNFIADEVQGVATLGYHIGAITPYIGYGREYYKDSLDPKRGFARTNNRDYKLSFAGLRYDIVPGISAKIEWNHIYDLEGTTGPFEIHDEILRERDLDAVDIYTFLIDAVF